MQIHEHFKFLSDHIYICLKNFSRDFIEKRADVINSGVVGALCIFVA